MFVKLEGEVGLKWPLNMEKHDEKFISDEVVIDKIYWVRNQKVMLDQYLAELYGIQTRRLNEQVKRNRERFPDDFMFELTEDEYLNLMSQIATSSWGGRRNRPYAFTEHGVLMLSSVLNSKRAIKVNVQIMRVYIKIREMLLANKDLFTRVEQVEKNLVKHDHNIELLFNYFGKFLQQDDQPREKIGYKLESEKKAQTN